jgi:hypothetical protein
VQDGFDCAQLALSRFLRQADSPSMRVSRLRRSENQIGT